MTAAAPRPDPVSAIALLDEPTRRRLYELVAASEAPVGRDQAAQALDISRELAAFHLDRLVAGGLLETEYRRLGERRGPGAGRPAKLYRRAPGEVAVSLPARDYRRAAEILETAIASIDDAGVATAIEQAAHAHGQATGTAARASGRLGRRATARQERAALVGLLGEGGYEPVVDATTNAIRLRNCPYHDLAQRNRDITCGMNLAWADGVVEGLGVTGVDPVLAPEPGSCCVVFEAAPGRPRASG
jgi:predicted ArsR family transcriptional regulator